MNLDQITREAFPLQTALHAGGLQRAAKPGVRYVVAKNGLWRAIDNAWLKTLVPVAISSTAVIPYGSLTQSVEFLCSMPPASLWREFAALAKAKLPNEVAAAMVWNSEHDTWRLAARKSINANSGFVKYMEALLEEGEQLVVDIHSHANHPAFFSETDNCDDFGSIKVSAVLGCVGQEATQIVVRLMLIDKHIDLRLTRSGGWEVQAEKETFNL